MPLTGLRVVDLTRILAGPFCSMLLGDMGAEVVKIETPGTGDPVPRQGAIRDGLSWYFAAFNRSKRSVTLNLRHPEGRAVLEKLIAQADVLVENFRPGVMAAMGFDNNDLRVKNRRAMNAAIEERLANGSSDYWIDKLNAAGVPCDRVKTLPEVFADPQTLEQEMVVSAAHPGHGLVRMLGFPIKFAEAPCRLYRPAPDLGADTDGVLRELGYSPNPTAARASTSISAGSRCSSPRCR
ncbi:MAG TPA: CoA transferase, partial [Stellaceae bacterium]|nr:CoA transferase [Stellaceae bacterium]